MSRLSSCRHCVNLDCSIDFYFDFYFDPDSYYYVLWYTRLFMNLPSSQFSKDSLRKDLYRSNSANPCSKMIKLRHSNHSWILRFFQRDFAWHIHHHFHIILVSKLWHRTKRKRINRWRYSSLMLWDFSFHLVIVQLKRQARSAIRRSSILR